MEQMVARPADVPAVEKGRFGDLEKGFFRRSRVGKGEVFFGCRYGEWVLSFPVGVDGRISRSGSGVPSPNEEIDLLFPESLGISDIKWVEDS